MRLLELDGTISAIGLSECSGDVIRYSHLEITHGVGRKVDLTNVWVTSEVNRHLVVGSEGVFYLDKVWVAGGGTVKHLWGIKSSNGSLYFDATNIGSSAGVRNILAGAVLAVLVVGVPIALIGIIQCVKSFGRTVERRRVFCGSAPIAIDSVKASEAIRI